MALKIPKGQNQSRSHTRAPKQEREMMQRLGAQLVRGSGSGDVKGDVRKRRVLRLECKVTSKKSFSLTREMVEKIEMAALCACGVEVPAICIEFIDKDGRQLSEVCVVPSYVLQLICENKGSDK